MKLVLGLGNPGQNHKRNRHNIGFMVLDRLAAEENLDFSRKTHYEYLTWGGHLLIKPRTFMNQSGLAVTSAMTSYRFAEILVISDDIWLPLGEMRFRHKGNSGGHNGLKSITASLGSDEFKRFRIGVGQPEEGRRMADFVLSNFSSSEDKLLEQVVQFAAQLLKVYLEQDFTAMLDSYSRNKTPILKENSTSGS